VAVEVVQLATCLPFMRFFWHSVFPVVLGWLPF
jgi:hypothetical protein